MSINTLCTVFRKIAVSRINAATVVAARYSTQQSNSIENIVNRLTASSCSIHGTESVGNIKFIPGSLQIDFGMPINETLRKNIIDIPIARIPPLHEPAKPLSIEYDSPLSEKSIDLPTSGEIIEKHAVRMLIIRRKKMKKHKRKKLAKKMKFVWEKIRFKRKQKKEKIFQNRLIQKIKRAQAFDAKKYVQKKLDILNKEWIPGTYRGEILSREMIKKFLDEKKAKKEARRNKPRLTL